MKDQDQTKRWALNMPVKERIHLDPHLAVLMDIRDLMERQVELLEKLQNNQPMLLALERIRSAAAGRNR